ncbi:MAG: gliding motility-associated C-terminal domain-containing protein [Bacteroidota bacterium]
MRQFFYPPPIRSLLMVFLLLLVGNNLLMAEGSVNFRTYPGNRLFYNVEQQQQLKVYAAAGEFINVGSSHVNINGGSIIVYNPNGDTVSVFTGTDMSTAIIFNHTQEDNGPTGTGLGSSGYRPGVVQVPADQGGIWTVELAYPNANRTAFVSNLQNSDNWSRTIHQPQLAADRRVALAWDVTVTQGGAGNAGGTPVSGRLYSNEYISILDGNNGANGPRSTSPTFYILTRDGYLYKVDFDTTDPWGFPIHSNSLGLVTGDFTPTYMSARIGADVITDSGSSSYTRSADTSTWMADATYLYEPQAEDIGPISNNKVFFSIPDPNLPASALVTDIHPDRMNTHTTWLLSSIPTLSDNRPFTFRGVLPANGICSGDLIAEAGIGGNFVFDSELGGQAILQLDINNDGDFTDDVDVTLDRNVGFGLDSIPWNGSDGNGNVIGATPTLPFRYNLTIRGGEMHLLLADIENNVGGVTFSRINGPNSPANQFFYDHTGIGGTASGGGTAGNPLPTTVPFTYQDSFGNENILDQWAFIETNNFGDGTLTIAIEDECSSTDNDRDGIPDIVDIDDDNDGVPDLLEYCHPDEGFACLPNGLDPSGDEDGDGIQNYLDADDTAVGNSCTDGNNDGVCDQIAAIYDTDGDNVPDHFDLDSDNDGISDLVEAGHGQPDLDGNGVIDGDSAAFGDNGFYFQLETSDAQDAVANYVPWDWDGDGIPDHDDLDSDNDGILDVVEAGYIDADTNQDGRIDDGNGNVPNVSSGGLVPLIDPAVTGVGIPLPVDWDSDGVPDWHDLDSDNDGILDVIEGGYQGNDTNLDGRIDDGNGNIPTVNSDGLPPVMQNGPITRPPDTDADGVQDWHDLDSDNDGINGTVENKNPDGDGDGFIGTGPITVDINGIATADANGSLTPFTPLVNTDNDGPGDFRDLESDGDGLTDVDEGGLADEDDDGIIGTGTPVVNQFGQATGVTSNPPDSNNDGTPDFQEFDCEAPETPTLAASATDLCEGDAVTLTATGVTPDPTISYIWTTSNDNGDTQITTTVPTLTLNPVTLSNAGTYTVTAVKDTCTGMASNPIVLVVNPKTATPVITASATSVCEGEAVTLSTDGAANETYQWVLTRADGSFAVVANATGPNLVLDPISADQAGTYTVSTTSGDCPSDVSDGVTISVLSSTTPPVITASATSVCEGEAVTLSTDGAADATYQWTLTDADGNAQVVDGATGSSLVLDPISAAQAGTYTVAIVNTDCPSGASEGVTISVTPKPDAPVLTVDDSIHCEGDRLEFTATPVAGNNVTYNFTFTNPDGRVDPLVTGTTLPSAIIEELVAANTGTYQVQAIVDGCPSDFSNDVAINVASGGLPDVVATSSAPTENPACEGDDVTLSVTPPVDGATYEWSGPNGVVGTTADVVLENATTAVNGEYSVTVTVNDCPKTLDPITVQVNPKPATPNIASDKTTVCSDEGFTLSTDEVAGENVTYDWSLNGTLVVSTDDPTLLVIAPTEADAGNYTVVVNGGGCPSDPSEPVAVMIQPPLEGNIMMEPANGVCEGETVTLTAPSAEGATYIWTGPNDFTATDQSITLENVSPADNGDYAVTVTVNGCPTDFGPTTLEINPKPAMPTLTVDNPNVCPDEGFTLSTDEVAVDNITYDWLLNGTLVVSTDDPTLLVIAATEADAGSYTVVINNGSCPSDPSEPVDVMIQPPLEGDIMMEPADGVCEGETVTLTAPNAEGATYTWTGPNDFTSTEQSITLENVSPADNGDYSVTVTVNGCPTDLGPTTLEINPKPATPSIASDKDSACPGEAVTLSTAAAAGDAITYEWSLNGAVVATTDEPTLEITDFQAENAGDYTVVVKDGSCPSDPSDPAATVALKEALEGVMASSNSPVCVGDSIMLSVTDVENATYMWTGPNGFTSDEQNPSIPDATTDDSGDYEVVVTVDGCPANIPPVTVEVTPKPDAPVVEVAEDNVCEGTLGIINVTSPDPIPAGTAFTVLDAAGTPVVSSMFPNIEVPTDGLDGIQFYTVISQVDGGCPSDPSEAVAINVVPKPTEEAMIITPPDGGDPCGIAPMTLEGNVPTEGTGTWTSSNPDVVFVDVDSPTTDVMGLEDGDMVTWTFANEICGEYAAASITISAMPPVTMANDDAFTILNTETIAGQNVTSNDTPSNGEVTVISGPSNGTGTIDAAGNLTYTPTDGFVGTDQIVYELCDTECPNAPCDQATVTITVNQDPANLDCVVSDVISPNGDGLNDNLIIACSDFKTVGLKIFNRWGDLVFESDNYNNEWDGTHDGADLPPGPYYYVFEEDGVEPTTGCVSIAR